MILWKQDKRLYMKLSEEFISTCIPVIPMAKSGLYRCKQIGIVQTFSWSSSSEANELSFSEWDPLHVEFCPTQIHFYKQSQRLYRDIKSIGSMKVSQGSSNILQPAHSMLTEKTYQTRGNTLVGMQGSPWQR